MPRFPNLRALTILPKDNTCSLAQQLRERDQDGYGRFVALMGMELHNAPSRIDPNAAWTVLRDFSSYESGPIKIVIVQLGDSPNELIFFTHNPPVAVQRLISSWEIDPKKVKRIKPYKCLHEASLEKMYGLAE